MPITFITDPLDPRLADYRDLKERRLNAEGGKFVAESELVVRKLLASTLEVHSVLVTAPRLKTLESALRDDPSAARDELTVLVAPQELVDAVAGFHVHRGCLAIASRPREASVPADARVIVALEDLVDVDNLGAICRNTAALGGDALLLSPRCADPYYRKSIRVSMGTVFSLPIHRAQSWPEELVQLRVSGFSLIAAVLDPTATSIHTFAPPPAFALVLGAEGPGLSPATIALCDHRLTIPMSQADSLNVATAAAVLLSHLTRAPQR
jgi:tRNA G18 (ribose-2'-O)-methylase SpoU